MTSNFSPARIGKFAAKALFGAGLLAGAALSAQAADYIFSGLIDSGPLQSSSFSGSFSFADVSSGYDGSVDLDAFSLSLLGQNYTLASADVAPTAYFVGGSFTGVDYGSTAASPSLLQPTVYLTSGFADVGEASFSYDTTGNGVQGFGSLSITQVSAVPEPGSVALMALGLGALGWSVKRRRG